MMDSSYIFCGRLALVSICITSIEAAPGNTGSRSSCWHLQDFGCSRQSEMKCCSSSIVGGRPQAATVRLNNGTADGQPHNAALRLGGKERQKALIQLFVL